MKLEQAVKILNDHHHRRYCKWLISGKLQEGEPYCTVLGRRHNDTHFDAFTPFEAIAIATAYMITDEYLENMSIVEHSRLRTWGRNNGYEHEQ